MQNLDSSNPNRSAHTPGGNVRIVNHDTKLFYRPRGGVGPRKKLEDPLLLEVNQPELKLPIARLNQLSSKRRTMSHSFHSNNFEAHAFSASVRLDEERRILRDKLSPGFANGLDSYHQGPHSNGRGKTSMEAKVSMAIQANSNELEPKQARAKTGYQNRGFREFLSGTRTPAKARRKIRIPGTPGYSSSFGAFEDFPQSLFYKGNGFPEETSKIFEEDSRIEDQTEEVVFQNEVLSEQSKKRPLKSSSSPKGYISPKSLDVHIQAMLSTKNGRGLKNLQSLGQQSPFSRQKKKRIVIDVNPEISTVNSLMSVSMGTPSTTMKRARSERKNQKISTNIFEEERFDDRVQEFLNSPRFLAENYHVTKKIQQGERNLNRKDTDMAFRERHQVDKMRMDLAKVSPKSRYLKIGQVELPLEVGASATARKMMIDKIIDGKQSIKQERLAEEKKEWEDEILKGVEKKENLRKWLQRRDDIMGRGFLGNAYYQMHALSPTQKAKVSDHMSFIMSDNTRFRNHKQPASPR